MSWMLLLSGLTWSYSWSVTTMRIVRWLLTGQYQSASVSIRRCWQSTGPSTVQHVTDHSTSKMSASLVATPSRSRFPHAAVYVSFKLIHQLICPARLALNQQLMHCVNFALCCYELFVCFAWTLSRYLLLYNNYYYYKCQNLSDTITTVAGALYQIYK